MGIDQAIAAVDQADGGGPGNRSVFRFPEPSETMISTGERYVSGLFGDIQSEHYHRYLFALRFCQDRDVLDVASGEGYGSALIGQTARSVVGVDLDAAAVQFANENYLTDRVSFRRGNATALPIADVSVDVVISFETIEHLADHAAFLGEVRRVLRPGGLLVLSSPDRRIYSDEPGHHNPFHLCELGRREFFDLIRTHFAHVELLEQRALTGSVIMRAMETGAGNATEGFATADGTLFERHVGLPEAPYLLAVASDAMPPPVPNSVMHTPRGIWHLEEMRQRAEKAAEENSTALAALARKLDEAAAERDLRGKEIDRRQAEIIELTRRLNEAAAERDLRGNEVDRQRAEITELTRRLNEAAAERDQLRTQLVEIEGSLRQILESTTWRLSRPAREWLARHPGLARLGRRSVRLLWWTLSGQLLSRIRQHLIWRREARKNGKDGVRIRSRRTPQKRAGYSYPRG